MRLLVLTGDHRQPDPTKWDGGYTEADFEMHHRMVEALESLSSYQIEVLSDHDRLIERITGTAPPELVLNFCDTGFRNVATRELHVPALLELYGIPYTGAGPAGMVLCYDKAIVRSVAQAHGVPVPSEVYVAADASVDEVLASGTVRWPSLVKPAQGDGSVGIRPDAVIHDASEARRYIDWFRAELPGRAALLQEFLPGEEYGLGLLGNPSSGFTAFPPLRVDYSGLPEDTTPILAFESKTGPANLYDAVEIVQATLDSGRFDVLRRHSEVLFERLQCRDYARFDFRTDAAGEIKLLEVNPNPAWSIDAKFSKMARFAGVEYPRLLELILEAARSRV